jgi:hypothetical protein
VASRSASGSAHRFQHRPSHTLCPLLSAGLWGGLVRAGARPRALIRAFDATGDRGSHRDTDQSREHPIPTGSPVSASPTANHTTPHTANHRNQDLTRSTNLSVAAPHLPEPRSSSARTTVQSPAELRHPRHGGSRLPVLVRSAGGGRAETSNQAGGGLAARSDSDGCSGLCGGDIAWPLRPCDAAELGVVLKRFRTKPV